MFRQLQEIRGMQVVTLSEGRIMGSVQKMYLNPKLKRVSGMVLKESRFSGGESWVDIRDIDKVGEDVIFVKRASVCKAKNPVGRSLKDLMGMQVATKGGKIIGSLVDVEIDDEWRVVEINLSEKRIVEIEPRQAIFGQDAILLRAGAEKQVRKAPRQKTGFLARVFGSEIVMETAGAISRAEKAGVPAKTASKTKKPARKTSPKKSRK